MAASGRGTVGSEQPLRTTRKGRGGGGTEPSRQRPAKQTCSADAESIALAIRC